jgi:hypothetical protein
MEAELGNLAIMVEKLRDENGLLRIRADAQDLKIIGLEQQLKTLTSLMDVKVSDSNGGGIAAVDMPTPETTTTPPTQDTPEAEKKPMRPEQILRIARLLHFVATYNGDKDKLVAAVALRPDLLRKRFMDSPHLGEKHGITLELVEQAIESAAQIHDARIAKNLAAEIDVPDKSKTKDKSKGGMEK